MKGWLDGEYISALADTGADIPLISAEYARQRGFRVDDSMENRTTMEFVDSATAQTVGMVRDLEWQFDSEFPQTTVHGLKDLPVDVPSSYDFLYETKAFSQHQDSFVNTAKTKIQMEPETRLLNVIKIVKPGANKLLAVFRR